MTSVSASPSWGSNLRIVTYGSTPILSIEFVDVSTKSAPLQDVYRSSQVPQGPLTGQSKLEQWAVQLIFRNLLGYRYRPVR